MSKVLDVIIIGGGASGLFSAILSAKKGLSVTILERNKTVGKKLALTGNGKCNYTNLYQSQNCYSSENPSFFYEIIEDFGAEEIIAYFKSLGILPDVKKGRCSTQTEAGYVYPYSGSGKDFVKVLNESCLSLNVKIRTNTMVKDIRKKGEVFEVITGENDYAYVAKNVIVASGGKALPSSGSDGNLNFVLEGLGHNFVAQFPALTAILTSKKEVKDLSGIRMQGEVSLREGEKVLGKESGELQFSEKGLSGIPVMQLSGLVGRKLQEGSSLHLLIDFYPFLEDDSLFQYLIKRREDLARREADSFFLGLFPEKLSGLLCRSFSKKYQRVSEISDKDLTKITSLIKGFQVPIDNVADFSGAQTTSGGISLSEVDDFLCSRKISNLYFAGEILDVDGLCGGYNLTWAFASAYRISKKIGEDT